MDQSNAPDQINMPGLVGYVLEVVEFITEAEGENGWMALGSKCKHVGYMCALFRTKKDACSYYDRHNPHMRSLNVHHTYCSDWDPDTRLLYIVRKDHDILRTVPPFTENESVVVERRGTRACHITESFL